MADTTTKVTHTPGPWSVDEFSGCTVWGPDNEHIADVRGYGAGLPQTANANLIAAAPEMYEALTDAERAMFEAGLSGSALFRKITAAITKAEGRNA